MAASAAGVPAVSLLLGSVPDETALHTARITRRAHLGKRTPAAKARPRQRHARGKGTPAALPLEQAKGHLEVYSGHPTKIR
jgi:hypothetical protein